MKRKYSKLAMISFVFGLGACLCSFSRPGGQALAISLGLMAFGFGSAARLSIRKAAVPMRGKKLASWGSGIGLISAILSFWILTSFVARQFNRAGQIQDRDSRVRKAVAKNPLRKERKPATEFTSNLPIVVLQADEENITKESDTVVRAQFFDTKNQRASLQAQPDYNGLGTIHLRGFSSLHQPKQSYTFHTVDAKTNQTKVALLGLPKEEDWVLYAPFEDKTLIRDVLAFQLANKMGHYAPRTRFVELFLRTSSGPVSMSDYAGIYVLIEKIKRGPDRVKIAKLERDQNQEPEISGGYIVKRDHSDRQESRFRTSRGGPYFYVYPNAQNITSQQKAWLSRYFKEFESALYGDNFDDPKRGYAAYLDVDSFIDAHWLIEASKNIDGFRYSSFLTKDRGGKLKPEPPWDWSRSFGNANYYDGWQTKGWYWSNLRPNEISWYQRLREDPQFAKRCNRRWAELRKTVFNPQQIKASIDQMAAQLEEAQQRNFQRWPILGTPVTCNYYVGDTYHDEVQWLKNWIEKRIAWIDSQVGVASNP